MNNYKKKKNKNNVKNKNNSSLKKSEWKYQYKKIQLWNENIGSKLINYCVCIGVFSIDDFWSVAWNQVSLGTAGQWCDPLIEAGTVDMDVSLQRQYQPAARKSNQWAADLSRRLSLL